jgi:glycerate kinase
MATRPPPRTVLAAPDAFKGTATATAVATAIATAADAAGWECDSCPLSDGGEGFADVLAAAGAGGSWRTTTVAGPLGAPVEARWWLAGADAVVESAAASGLPLAGGAEGNDPLRAGTRGTGQLVAAAVAAGARRVLLGVGGSASTDGGRGAVEAIEEAGGLGATELVVACDVDTGFVEAAARFGPQKGATPAQVAELEGRLAAMAADLRRRYGVDVRAIPGAGAAGGLAGGLAALGARLVPGFEVVAGAVGLAGRVRQADLVVTGEGRLDASSWSGKVVDGVVRTAAAGRGGRGGGAVAVAVVAGAVGPGALEGVAAARRAGAGVVEVHSLTDRFGSDRAVADPTGCVRDLVGEILRRDRPLTTK